MEDRSAIEQHVLELDQDWGKAGAARSVDGWVSFYAADAVVLPPNEKTADTPAAIRASVSELLTLPEVQVAWRPSKIFVSDAGDMAYLYGTYTLHAKDPSGMPINDFGKIAEIWRRQTDGNWKCVLDTWSSDLPVAAPVPGPTTVPASSPTK